MRLEVLTTISGVTFSECFPARVQDDIDGVRVSIIGLADLRKNKRAAGRHRDLDDLDRLP
jgi:predicted nucleotidyltransferase